MNPGTTIIIVLGIIGLLLYASKALKATVTENFALVSDDQISSKGSDAMADLKTGALSMQSLFSAFGTPDMLKDPPTSVGPPIGGLGMGGPSPADFTEFNKPATPAVPDFKPPPPLVPPTTALPVIGPTGEAAGLSAMPAPAPMPASLIPASLLPPPTPPQPKLESPEPVNPFNHPSMTMADKQGELYKKGISASAESFEEGSAPDIPGTSMSTKSNKKHHSDKKHHSSPHKKDHSGAEGGGSRKHKDGKRHSLHRTASEKRASSSRAKKLMSKNSLKAAAKSDIQKAALSSAAAGGLTVLRDEDGKTSHLTKFKGPKVIYRDRKCPPMPDMSLYIRKDAIPCWGCNLK